MFRFNNSGRFANYKFATVRTIGINAADRTRKESPGCRLVRRNSESAVQRAERQRYGTVSAALPLCKLQICNGSSVTHQKKTRNISSFFGAADRTRTDTVSPPRDFKSLASAIPPQRHILFCFAFSLAVWKTHWMNIVHSSAIPPQRHRKFVCRIFRQTTKMIVARRTVFVNNYRLTFGRFVISSFFSGLRR